MLLKQRNNDIHKIIIIKNNIKKIENLFIKWKKKDKNLYIITREFFDIVYIFDIIKIQYIEKTKVF
jgi:hypothetical protein